MSEDVYIYAQKWVEERADGQKIDVLIDLPGYGWEELIAIDFGLSVAFATIRRSSVGNHIEEVGFDAPQLKAIRRSPNEPALDQHRPPSIK